MNTLTLILIVIAILAVAFGIFMYIQKERTRRLKGRFGPEYDRVVQDRGNSRAAEDELLKREKRVHRFHVRELQQAEIARFTDAWREVQARFVDTPREAVAQADRLVRDVMSARGYPMTDFEQRAADISVDHPRVVEHYRAAHDIALRDSADQTNTEDLRQAMVHYHALFDELLGTAATHPIQEVRKVQEVKR